MPWIECTLGEAEPTIAGTTYHFTRDQHNRFTCFVDRQEDVACLLAVDPYRQVPEHPTNEEAKPEPVEAEVESEQVTKPEEKTEKPAKTSKPETTKTDQSEPKQTVPDTEGQKEDLDDTPEVTPEALRQAAAEVTAGTMSAPEGVTPEDYVKQLEAAAAQMEEGADKEPPAAVEQPDADAAAKTETATSKKKPAPKTRRRRAKPATGKTV